MYSFIVGNEKEISLKQIDLFLFQPTFKFEEVNNQVDVLENELKQQLKSNEVLLMTLKNIRQQIIKTGKDIKHLLAENPSALAQQNANHVKDVSYCDVN